MKNIYFFLQLGLSLVDKNYLHFTGRGHLDGHSSLMSLSSVMLLKEVVTVCVYMNMPGSCRVLTLDIQVYSTV